MVRLIQKDLRIVQAIAQAVGLPLEGPPLAQQYFADNEAHDEGALGTQAMFKALERRKNARRARRRGRRPGVGGRAAVAQRRGAGRRAGAASSFFFRSSIFCRTRSTDHLGST